MEDLALSIRQNESQLLMVKEALINTVNQEERESLSALQSELEELIKLTKESYDQQSNKNNPQCSKVHDKDESSNEIDEEYALFMKEMSESGAYENNKDGVDGSKDNSKVSDDSDIEDELASLLGMKCAVYHTHSWGGQPTLHNAMVSSVIPRRDDDQFNDLQVRVLYTHPTHAEMLPCPFYLNGDCKFSDEQCRYSHGAIVNLSDLKEAIEPEYESIKVGSSILLKLKPPDNEDMTVAKKSTEKYHLWHRAIVKGVDMEKRMCVARLEQGSQVGDKRKSASEEYHVQFEEIFPLHAASDVDSDSDDSLSGTEYPEIKTIRTETEDKALLIEKSLQNNAPAMGEWERHTRGMGSKLMLAMGYVPGTGLGAAADGRLRPVEARVMPKGASLDRALQLAGRQASKDPLEVEKKLKRLQKREEERNKRAYEREKERERRNVFNFINKTLGDKSENPEPTVSDQKIDIKQSTSKDLNIEQFKVAEDCRKVECELVRLNNSLVKYPTGSSGHRSVAGQISEKNKELHILRDKERQIANEQKHRKDKQKLTVF